MAGEAALSTPSRMKMKWQSGCPKPLWSGLHTATTTRVSVRAHSPVYLIALSNCAHFSIDTTTLQSIRRALELLNLLNVLAVSTEQDTD